MNNRIDVKKRILFVTIGLSIGGAERVIVNLINKLNKDKYNILLIVFNKEQDYLNELAPIVNVICLDKKSRWDFVKLIFRLRRVICEFKPSIIISFLDYANITAGLAALFLSKRFRLILCERNYYRSYLLPYTPGIFKRWLMSIIYKKADKVLAVSNNIREILKEDFNIQPDKLKTIYNPVNLDLIAYKSKEDVMHPFFKYKGAKVIIAVGRLTRQKRFDRLLRIFHIINKKEKQVYLIIVGKGELYNNLKKLASELDIERYVDFVGFQLNPYAWISKADVLILTSDWEGFPNVIIEAMACNTAVVSKDCLSGPDEIITNGENGILVSSSDDSEFAKEILNLLKNEDLRKKLSQNGKKRIEDLRIDKIVSQYEEVFCEDDVKNI